MDGLRLLTDTPDPSLLGVSQSVNGRCWRGDSTDSLHGMAIAQLLGVPEIVGRIMAARGVQVEAAGRFLTPTLRDWLPDPSRLKDMDVATERLELAIRQRQRITVFGDYDVDGAASSALLHRYMRLLDVPVETYIPDRISEGYGPNSVALRRLKENGADLVVFVDCGTLAFQPLADAAAIGLDTIVVDHHAAEPMLPACAALVNPNRLDDESGVGHLCAAGIAFLLLISLNRALRRSGFFEARAEPELMSMLDLVALATVCDVMPLIGLNRALVAQGLKIMAQRGRPGLAALADGAGIAQRIDAYHLGFVLGPRVNAGGRVGRSDLGSRLLATDDPLEARSLAAELERMNISRRDVEAGLVAEAIAAVDATISPETKVIVAAGEGWHPGVIGIAAARLKERYDRPACVIAWEDGARENRIGKGSGRSVAGFDLGAAIIAARQAGILIGGGGHAMAAGFTIAGERLGDFEAFLTARVGSAAPSQPAATIRTLHIDGVLHPTACTPDLLRTLAALGPFGSGNPEPRFALANARIAMADIVGQNHVRCVVTAAGAAGRLKAIAFRALDTPLGAALLASAGGALHLAGHLRLDTWQGREEVQLQITDAAAISG